MNAGIEKTTFYQTALRRLFFGAVLLFFSAVILFGIFYTLSSYQYLQHWFISMNDCFYRNYDWTNRFFTPQVKADGNLYAITAIVVAFIGIAYMVLRRRRYLSPRYSHEYALPGSGQIKLYIGVVALACGIWYWGQGLVKPSADEIFSAVNCAELSPFQILAYYMLPNNHVYFNFINGYLARWANADPVITGRFLSLLAYSGVLCAVYYWFSRLLRSRIWAFVALAPVALQFTPWAFAFQARGYECQLFCAWIAFLSLYAYLDTGKDSMLRINTLFCIFGFALVPTFLYYFVTQFLLLALVQMYSGKFSLAPWKYSAICVAGVFLLYLPALCFSGKAALAANDYVKTAGEPLSAFVPHWIEGFKYFVNFIFSFLVREDHPVNFVLFFIPLLLFLFPGKERRRLAVFYILLWLVWAVLCAYMKRLPFARNMILHYSLSIGIIIYTIYSLLELVWRGVKSVALNNILRACTFAVPAIVLCIHLVTVNKGMVHYFLYFMDVNGMYTSYTTDLENIPPNSTVAFSDERYCFYYYCRKSPRKPSRCPTGNEEYYIKSAGEALPEMISKNYVLYKVCFSGDIYKHR